MAKTDEGGRFLFGESSGSPTNPDLFIESPCLQLHKASRRPCYSLRVFKCDSLLLVNEDPGHTSHLEFAMQYNLVSRKSNANKRDMAWAWWWLFLDWTHCAYGWWEQKRKIDIKWRNPRECTWAMACRCEQGQNRSEPLSLKHLKNLIHACKTRSAFPKNIPFLKNLENERHAWKTRLSWILVINFRYHSHIELTRGLRSWQGFSGHRSETRKEKHSFCPPTFSFFRSFFKSRG